MTDANGRTRTLRLAAVQMQSRLGCIEENLEHATPLVERAAAGGAQLIALAELAASGYSMSKAIWDAGETRRGLTVQWLQDTSRRLGVYLGIGFVEADGVDFYNSYALGTPDGQIAGFVRKTMAETSCFKCAGGSHVIETPIGRAGIGICADNLFVPNLVRMQAGGADLLLMPHAAPLPYKEGGLVSEADMVQTRRSLIQMAPNYARLIGIPVVFINQVGPRGPEKWDGIFGAMMSPDQFYLGGLSTIADSDGKILGRLDERAESLAIADVCLDGARKITTRPVGHGSYGGGFVTPHPRLFEGICYTGAFFGQLSYRLSGERKRKAQAASSDTHSIKSRPPLASPT